MYSMRRSVILPSKPGSGVKSSQVGELPWQLIPSAEEVRGRAKRVMAVKKRVVCILMWTSLLDFVVGINVSVNKEDT